MRSIATDLSVLGGITVAGLALAATSEDADQETFALGVAVVH